MIVVSNTSPVIAFGKLNRFSILEAVFGKIIIPSYVFLELNNLKYKDEINLKESVFKTEEISFVDPLLEKELDRREAEAITLALKKNADWLIIDERKGRNIAKNVYGINVIGTAGILLKAKESGIINQVSPLLQELKK
ncbi:MAG TPA: DUF3368 domain-containing protein [Leptospiraceae bacterium]|nr:DUF3368 domain-containing protein [Leptospiraceae bacterium]HMY65427.1 DUF3368 domain-containing protein [Leptospiraceae bacterium]HNF15465.1 DUF3368 domain-containing protein [Leptospiraceae bacterium]HNH06866.1 DUF3368 domain-containing protein [Leptospiraceae bacterium]HNI96747.1 DUF3368 domain-containing protein [Leptospiraceae bacterium]